MQKDYVSPLYDEPFDYNRYYVLRLYFSACSSDDPHYSPPTHEYPYPYPQKPTNPWKPIPIPTETHTHRCGYGFLWVRVWVWFEIPRGYPRYSLDIGWLETIAVELIAYVLEAERIHDVVVIVHSDNQGTIGAMDKGRSPNTHINLSIQRTYSVLCPNFITFSFEYIQSELNPADSLSRGKMGPPQDRLDLSFKLPVELSPILIHAI